MMTTIGIAYPGEMGTALAKAMSGAGFRIVTTLTGRSPRTASLAAEVGIESLPSIDHVVRTADAILSVVRPDAGEEVADDFAAAAERTGASPLYIDLNSISPATAARVCTSLEARHLRSVDGSIHGLASRLSDMATVYLSGPHAPEAETLLGGTLRTRVVGEEWGDASAFKLMLSGLSKGMVALFLEAGLLAEERGVLPELVESARYYYPGVMEALERLVPTYPRHAARRAGEMRDLAAFIEECGLRAEMSTAAERVIEGVAAAQLENGRIGPWTIEQVVRELHRSRPEARRPRMNANERE